RVAGSQPLPDENADAAGARGRRATRARRLSSPLAQELRRRAVPRRGPRARRAGRGRPSVTPTRADITMERRPEPSESLHSETAPSETDVDARTSLALWLRAGRAHRGMSLDDVAKVTKIQPRILERLETGKLDGLPAEVFVRGFVRSFARCVGLDEREALR